MSNIDLDNVQLLKEATNLLLQRVTEALRSQKDFKDNKEIFGQAAPFLTIKGTGEMIDEQSQMKSGGESPRASFLSKEDEELVKTMAARARQRNIERSRLSPLRTPEVES